MENCSEVSVPRTVLKSISGSHQATESLSASSALVSGQRAPLRGVTVASPAAGVGEEKSLSSTLSARSARAPPGLSPSMAPSALHMSVSFLFLPLDN